MFESLSDQIKDDTRGQQSTKERVIVYLAIAVVSLLIFGGLIFGVRMLG
jgi:hypothetical protein